ncbi:hypothetical protein [Schinkia azotoformans]|uniref:hypothetical protein n=1 Tax=Schinkia azotoformans TaxID=1454 RepID=UPI002DBCD311|nr:hypothetical protein [Schinkia azotoformans]MEC1780097.1 hypothetical protein [Schinkia azotoformans]MED4330824.1 hypothetical protein [Schinkia azotoformans]
MNINVIEKNQGVKQFEVNGTVELPISIIVEAKDIYEATFKAECQVSDLAIQQAFLTFLLTNGNVISPKVNDFSCEIEYVGCEEHDEEYRII